MAVQTLNRPDTSPDEHLGRAVFWSSAITALGGLLFGYDTGVVSGALLFLHRSFGPLSSLQKELVTSLLLVGAAIGAAGAGRLADRFGRRPLILGTAAVFVVGVLGAAFAADYFMLVAMRVVIGLAVGSASMSVPLYIGELAPARYRGALVSLNQLAITSGILFSFLIDYWLASTQNWRLMFGLAAIPAAMLFVGTLLQPESPHWLISHGRIDEAREILGRYRHGDENVDDEIKDVKELAGRRSSWSDLVEPKVRKLVVIGVALAVFQQITGINTVIYYAPTLLKNAGFGSSAALLANVGNGVVNVGLTIVAIMIIDRVGRRPLLVFGTAGMAVALAVIGIDFAVGGDQLHGAGAVVAIVALAGYTGSFAIGLGPVFWLLISELYPQQLRGTAMSVATIANWAANFVVTISFLTLLNAITNAGTFLLFAAITVVALVYFAVKVPETKGRTLQEIERDLT
jgi:sugar porter (SP) family MFS transporter